MTKETLQEYDDLIQIKPEKIIFERLFSLGNYENVKIGGTYAIPENTTVEQAMKMIAKSIAKQIDRYREVKEKDDDLSNYRKEEIENQLDRAKQEIERYAKYEKMEEQNIKEAIGYVLIESLEDMINDLKIAVGRYNNTLTSLFHQRKKIIEENNISIEKYEEKAKQLSQEFQFQEINK